jgi:ribosomal protein L37AE/L43A
VAEVLSLCRHGLLILGGASHGGQRVEEGPVKRNSGHQCAQCGAVLIAPEWSEHFPDNRIRNVWSCEACGYEFEDTVYLSTRELVDVE